MSTIPTGTCESGGNDRESHSGSTLLLPPKRAGHDQVQRDGRLHEPAPEVTEQG